MFYLFSALFGLHFASRDCSCSELWRLGSVTVQRRSVAIPFTPRSVVWSWSQDAVWDDVLLSFRCTAGGCLKNKSKSVRSPSILPPTTTTPSGRRSCRLQTAVRIQTQPTGLTTMVENAHLSVQRRRPPPRIEITRPRRRRRRLPLLIVLIKFWTERDFSRQRRVWKLLVCG